MLNSAPAALASRGVGRDFGEAAGRRCPGYSACAGVWGWFALCHWDIPAWTLLSRSGESQKLQGTGTCDPVWEESEMGFRRRRRNSNSSAGAGLSLGRLVWTAEGGFVPCGLQ